MPNPYPVTLQSPNVTAAIPEVRSLVFDFIAARQASGVDRIAVERMLLAHGHHPGAAKVILADWHAAGATSQQTASQTVVYHRLKVAA